MSTTRFSGTTLKRIHREIADLKKEDLGGISVGPISADKPFLWKARIPGPEGSVYEGGVFSVEITLGHDYPFSAPKVLFLTRIYHMNISEKGNVCIDILKNNWSPALSIFKVVLSLSSLLTDPNPSDPLVPSIATEFLRKRPTHDQTARHWTELYAKPTPPPSPPSTVSSNPPSSVAGTTTSGTTTRASAKGKGRASAQSAGPEEQATTDVDLTGDGIEAVSRPTRGTKRRKEVHASDSVIDLSEEVEASSTRGGKRRHVEMLGDVIVIED
ncbi:ubiquitin-conjugating enzyme/RWD-like protein [Lactarius sanguifluus]|nr:ubiquitin-conjugating enzyme/RWD-like protein [Lactarius sanguifluus]KAH9173802.1 ubiquitin-conjugating enzyme/RWD-like protein [Lactarius sanguifluus]